MVYNKMIDRCELVECAFNRDGACLDRVALKVKDKQTGCIYYDYKNMNEGDFKSGEKEVKY